jgi:uncharacterized membrane protein YkoI
MDDGAMTTTKATPMIAGTSRRLPRALAACLLLAAAAAGPVALAGRHDGHGHTEARELLRRGEILPLAAILQVAAKQVPGDVIEVELEHEDKGWEYDVKVLTPAGQVRKLTIDARHGKVLRIKDD